MTRLAVPAALLFAAAAGPARPGSDGGAGVVAAPPEDPEPAPETVALAAPDALAALCRAVGPGGGPRGDAIERARAEADRGRAREAALGRRYRVTVPARRLAFAAWDGDGEVLRLAPRTVLLALDGALRLWPVDDPQLPARAPAGAVRRILDAQRRGTLSLALTFELDQDDDDDTTPCAHVPGARQYTLAISPVSWAWSSRGEVLARGGDGADRPILSAAEGARLAVEVGSAVGEGDVGAASEPLAARAEALRACYAAALRRSPRLDGVLVVELRLDPRGGPPRGARVSADSVQDPQLADCALGVAAGARFPGGAAGTASVPVRFSLEEPGPPR